MEGEWIEDMIDSSLLQAVKLRDRVNPPASVHFQAKNLAPLLTRSTGVSSLTFVTSHITSCILSKAHN